MLVLNRREGQWTDITHEATGQLLRVRVTEVGNGTVNLVFEDDVRNFKIDRPERKAKTE